MNIDATPLSTQTMRSVGGYHLLRPIAVGGMSVVHLAFDLARQRHVALKILSEELAVQKEFVRRFAREARLGKQVSHQNLIAVWDSGYDPSTNKNYLAMEFIDGPSAHSHLGQRGTLPISEVIKIGCDIAQALGHLHASGWIHRDIKPENILLPSAGPTKLGDLGLAKRRDTSGDLSAHRQGIGTPNYMSYEQSLNASFADERSDFFSLGATLFHLATGQLPFAGGTPAEQAKDKIDNRMRKAAGYRPEIPHAFDEFIAKALAFDPRLRYSSAAEFELALLKMETRLDTSTTTDSSPLDLSTSPTRYDLPKTLPERNG